MEVTRSMKYINDSGDMIAVDTEYANHKKWYRLARISAKTGLACPLNPYRYKDPDTAQSALWVYACEHGYTEVREDD